jgi:serine/threonine-protein kinase
LIGQTLSHFKITAKLGEGGMGEVYLGQDTKLGREVAIKVMPEALTSDPERMARFEREAKVLAALNHQNIAGIHEVGTAALTDPEGSPETTRQVSYLVMEYVPGEDLADVIGRGAIAIDEALPMAVQITEALEAAHERGIVHRDLKPANVRLTPDGQVKVLDFGLARAWDDGEEKSSDLSMSPTLTAQMTEAGVILGTAAYMSPEQARGKRVDKRTDIWAFGVLLFEMLTGRRGYEGETVTDLIAAIVTRDPDWDQLPVDIAPRLRALLTRCLEKDPLQRLRDIGDARIELGAILTQPETPIIGAAPDGHERRTTSLVAWTIAALTSLLALAALTWRTPDSEPGSEGIRRLSVVLPETQEVVQYDSIAVSPLGSEVVYTATEGGVSRLYRRPLDTASPLPVAGSEGGQDPFFSPDGDAVGFTADGKLRVVPVVGGAAREVCDCPPQYGATWSIDGTIVFNPRWNSGLWAVSAAVSGGKPRELTVLDVERGDVTHLFPQALPDGKRVLFTVWSSEGPRAAVASIETGAIQVVHEGGLSYRYAESGHLLFGQGGTLQALAFDLDSLETTGQPVQLADGLFGYSVDGFAAFEVSSAGLLAYRSGGQANQRQFIWSDRQSNIRPALDVIGSFGNAGLSSDGSRLAVEQPGPNGPLQIVVFDLGGGLRTQLTTRGDNINPVFSPDGASVVFSQALSGDYQLMLVPVDGSAAPTALAKTESEYVRVIGFSPDGQFLTYDARHPITGREAYVLELDSENPPQKLLEASGGQTHHAMISPDGQWVVYVSDASGRNELYIKPWNAPGVASQITSDGGFAPKWNPTGNGEIFYALGTELMSLVLDTRGAPRISQPPRALFEFPGVPATVNDDGFEVGPDGESFLFMQAVHPGPEANQIHLILNLFDELSSE